MPRTELTQCERVLLKLDCTVSLEHLIGQGGFAHVAQYYKPQHFSLGVNATEEVTILHARGFASSYQVIRWMKQSGFVPARLDHALAMEIQFPKLQREGPTVFLGTVWRDFDGDDRVPSLEGPPCCRELGLEWFESGWVGVDFFAATRL
jgi:hypothetical protein